MQTRGQHLLLDLWLRDPLCDENVDRLLHLVRSEFTVVRETRRDFEPYGTTIVFVLSESHFTLHTYPEHDYLSVDLYICRFDIDLAAFSDRVKTILNVKNVAEQIVLRGVPAKAPQVSMRGHQMMMHSELTDANV